MISLEESYGRRFKLVVSTREDVFLFRPVLLAPLLAQADDECDFVAPKCLTWGGLNMHFQLMRRRWGLAFLANRLSFYSDLISTNRRASNPQQFEKLHANQLGMVLCPQPPTRLAAIAARHWEGGRLCFIESETLESCTIGGRPISWHDRQRSGCPAVPCYPRENASFINGRICPGKITTRSYARRPPGRA